MPDEITKTLRAALSRLEAERQRIDRQMTAIRTALGGVPDGRPSPRRRRRMSATARRAVSQRMKAYWAARRGGKGGGKGTSNTKGAAGSKAATKAKSKSEKPAAK